MQNREPPAFQEYAASMLASRAFRLSTATERGVLYTMKLECWVNKTTPSEPRALAKILGLDAGDVDAALPAVMPFFAVENGEIRCPELDRYREHLEARHAKQSKGGKASAATRSGDKAGKSKETKPVRNKTVACDADSTASTLEAPFKHLSSTLQGLSAVQLTTTKSNPSPVKGLPATDSWVAEYDSADVVSAEAKRKSSGADADAYRRASRGGAI